MRRSIRHLSDVLSDARALRTPQDSCVLKVHAIRCRYPTPIRCPIRPLSDAVSDPYPTPIRRLSDAYPTPIRPPSDPHPTPIRPPSDPNPTPVRNTLDTNLTLVLTMHCHAINNMSQDNRGSFAASTSRGALQLGSELFPQTPPLHSCISVHRISHIAYGTQ